MINDKRFIRSVLTCLIILTVFMFNVNYISHAHENGNKEKDIINIEKLNINDIDFISEDYEKAKHLLLGNDKKNLVLDKTNDNLGDEYKLRHQLLRQNESENYGVALLGDDDITYWEVEPNDTIYMANKITSKSNGSLGHKIFGSITDYNYDIDYYRISLSQKGVLDIFGIWMGDISEMGWEDDLGIGLKDASGELIHAAILKGYGNHTYRNILEVLDPGIYYIMVIQMSDYKYLYTDEFYGLSVDFEPYNTKSYDITFNSNGGSVINKLLVESNGLVQEPSPPIKTGYMFGGWYKESTLKNKWNFDSDRVMNDMTLYAKWTINKYAVIFNSEGGSYVENILVNYNSLIRLPSSPIKTGYTFGGWYKESTLKNKWNFNSDRITNNINLHAKWYIINDDYILMIDNKAKLFKEKQTNIITSKTWAIEFNQTLDPYTINKQNIIVWDKTNNLNIEVIIEYQDNTLIIKSPLKLYTEDTDYVIYITENIMSIDGESLNSTIKFEFKTD